ncbi:MAG: hypothetical protein VB115_10775 [Christensenellaceae bacterium]|nr:hypothetical protein [Christensenellaceae bacterium]
MRRMRIFLSAILTAVLFVGACAHAETGFTKREIETLDASVPFDSDFGRISIASVNEKPMFAPAGMTDEQRAVMISLSMPPAFLDDLKAKGAEISSEFFLLSAEGLFKPGAVTQMDGEDGLMTVNLIIAIPKAGALEDHRLIFNGQARTLVFADDAETVPAHAEGDVAFTVGGVVYTVCRLDDAPALALPNRLDGHEGHAVAFSYTVPAAQAKDANAQLYSNTWLLQPDGREVHVYSNADNLGNPYELYFGLSDGVLLNECVLAVRTDDGEKLFALSDDAKAAFEARGTAYPIAEAGAQPEPAAAPAEEPGGMSEETDALQAFAGDWVGSTGNIDLSFTVNADGTGLYTFEQNGYTESYDVALSAASETFTVDIPADNKLGIVTCEGGYQYADGALTLDVRTTFKSGRVFEYTIPCRRVEASNEPTAFHDDQFKPALPEHASVTFEGTAYDIRVTDIALDDNGNRSITIDGFGEALHIRSGKTIAHIQLEMLAGGTTYKWSNLSVKNGRATFSFDTALYPETIYAYSYDDDTRVEMRVAAEAAPAADAPAPEAAPTAEPAADMTEAVSNLLSELAQSEAADPWRLAIYQAGAQTVTGDGQALSFLLRSFNPGLDRLGNYDADKKAYLDGLLSNVRAYGLEVKLALEDGAIGADAKETIRDAVGKAASAAKTAFDQKAVRIAIADYLFPAHEDADAERAPLFRAQAKQSLSVAGGPHALSLRCSGANPEKLLEAARTNAYAAFAKVSGANQSESAAIREAFLSALAARAAEVQKKPDEEFTLTLDIDDLAQDEVGDYDAYLKRYAFDEALDALADQVYGLPDVPAQEFPKSGRVSGSTKGTKVIVKAPDDQKGRYIQLRHDDTGEVAVTGFIRSGKSCTVRVPKGQYHILVASGATWYGEKALFGDAGSYSRTEAFEVLGGNYYHTITLGGVTDGNMSSYGADPSDFQ